MRNLTFLSLIFTIVIVSAFSLSENTEAQEGLGLRQPSLQRASSNKSLKQKIGTADSPSGTTCNPSGTITVGGAVINGNLASGDCQFEDGTYFDLYTLNGTAGDRLTVSMTSTAFDAYLILFDSDGEILTEDDDGGGSGNARIPFDQGVIVLPYTGVYYIGANSFDVATGAYELAASRPAECATTTTITPSATINSSISSSDCKVNLDGSIFYTKFYSFSGTSGQQLSFSMNASSGNLDPYLILRTPSGIGTIEDDAGGGGTAARIPAGTGFVTLPETGTYILEASSSSEFQTGDFSLQIGQSCEFSLSPSSPQVVSGDGGNISVTVSANVGCNWTATSNATWMTVTAGSSGAGGGTVSINVASNPGTTREGTLTIAGQTYTVSQSGVPCTYTLSPTSTEVGAPSGTGSFTVTAPSGCQWTAVSNAGFITTTSSGTGDGTVAYSFTANSGESRSGTITVAGQTFILNQQSTCANSVNLGIGNVPTTPGSTITIPVTASNTTGLGISAFDFDIRFDPALLSPATPFITNSGNMTDGWTLTPNVDAGKLILSGFTTGSLTGEGTLFNIRFNVIATTATTTDLTWQKSQLNEGTPCSQALGGTVTVFNGSIAGKVQYFFGQNPVAVPGVTLSASGSPNISATTASNGTFSLQGFGLGSYTLTPSKTDGATTGAISSLDASAVAQFSVGLISLTANQQIAADVSGDGTISSLDASRIAQWSVGLTLPSGDRTGTWKWTPSTRTYASVIEELTGQDFTAILMGDVTGNWTPPQNIGGTSDENAMTSVISDYSSPASGVVLGSSAADAKKTGFRNRWNESVGDKLTPGEILEIPINVSDASSILSYDAVITYDADVLEPVFERPVSTTGTLSVNFNIVANRGEPGKLRLSAYGVVPVTGDGELLIIRFRVKSKGDANLEFESLQFNETKIIEAPLKDLKVLPRSRRLED